jgi:hypothetical protein
VLFLATGTAHADPINLPSTMLGSWCYKDGTEIRQTYIRNNGICIGTKGVLTVWPDGYGGSDGTCAVERIKPARDERLFGASELQGFVERPIRWSDLDRECRAFNYQHATETNDGWPVAMSFLAIWRSRHPGQPDPDEATLRRFREPILIGWREEHPGQPDPDEAALYKWLCEQEREGFIEQWREAHPGQHLPDDYKEIRRWAINERNKRAIAFRRAWGEKFH